MKLNTCKQCKETLHFTKPVIRYQRTDEYYDAGGNSKERLVDAGIFCSDRCLEKYVRAQEREELTP